MSVVDAWNRRGPLPALTWWDEAGRTELSGRVLLNWVAKSTNFLVAELGVGPGSDVLIDMPAHWKRAVIEYSALLSGAGVRYAGSDAGTSDVLVTDRPDTALAESAGDVLAVEPVSLALRFPDPLEALTIDWLVAIRSHADSLEVPVSLAALEGTAVPGGMDATAPEAVVLAGIDGEHRGSAIAEWMQGRRVLAPGPSIPASDLVAEGF